MLDLMDHFRVQPPPAVRMTPVECDLLVKDAKECNFAALMALIMRGRAAIV